MEREKHFSAQKPCYGDEGGGLVVDYEGIGKVLVGILSLELDCRKDPAIYTPVYCEIFIGPSCQLVDEIPVIKFYFIFV